MAGLNHILDFDELTGVVRVQAGVSLAELLKQFAPRGWFVPVLPGTRHVSVGGAFASDIHGKGHHLDGSFANHVRSISLLNAAGEINTYQSDSDEFWATAGGMGLTGIILDLQLQLQPVETTFMWASDKRCTDLDSLMNALSTIGNDAHFSAAWIDTASRGSKFGRGVISVGENATIDQSAGNQKLELVRTKTITAPGWAPNQLLNPLSIRAFNEVWFRKAPKTLAYGPTSVADFFHPLDMVEGWNRIYGSRGFLQYQFVVPDAASHLIQQAIERLQQIGAPSFLSVLKRFGPGNQGPLSFPIAGWTLALDIPTNVPGLGPTLDLLDFEVAQAGGRVYLTKDSRLEPEILQQMYPNLDQWRTTRNSLDPTNRFQSDLSRRLGLTAN